MKPLNRIAMNPRFMGGKPRVQCMRVTAGTIVGLMASRHTPEAILEMYPYLEK